MRSMLVIAALVLLSVSGLAQSVTPEISSWVRNTTGATGYAGIPSNVQTVQYSAGSVYISCTCIPGYSIGPWIGQPNVPSNQNFVFQITRTPQPNTGTATAIGLGHIGVWTNGVSIFNAADAQTYNNQGVWHRNAYFFEGVGFDNCLGHPQQQGEYHHHVNPKCLYNDADSTHHSPIIGWAWDGYPVYGAYGYANATTPGTIRRMTPSFRLRNITDRTTLPGGAAASSAGPAINTTYPLGAFLEDYEYVTGIGDLDDHNGRYCKTPDYPNGTYAYFVTIDATRTPVYPYTLGSTYYGVVPPVNIGPNSGHVTITEPTTVYNGYPASAGSIAPAIKYHLYPNPIKDWAYIDIDPASMNNLTATIYNTAGELVQTYTNWQPSISYAIDCTSFSSGVYSMHLKSGDKEIVQKLLIVK